jgi:hypothetical protein
MKRPVAFNSIVKSARSPISNRPSICALVFGEALPGVTLSPALKGLGRLSWRFPGEADAVTLLPDANVRIAPLGLSGPNY